jgi:hypothetical protein
MIEEIVILIMVLVSLRGFVLLINFELLHLTNGILLFSLSLCHLVLLDCLILALFLPTLNVLSLLDSFLLLLILLALECFKDIVVVQQSVGEFILKVLIVKELRYSPVNYRHLQHFVDCGSASGVFCQKRTYKSVKRA